MAARHVHLRPGADSAALRELARQAHPRIAKRLRVIALLADGLSTLDAAARERVNDQTVREWRALYRKGGTRALMQVPTGRRAWLSEKQSAALVTMIRRNPSVTYADLGALVRRRFRVVYTPSGLEALTRRLGFMRHDGRFFGGSPA